MNVHRRQLHDHRLGARDFNRLGASAAVFELPRFARPVAAVSIFLPAQITRALQDYRPRLVLDAQGALILAQPAGGFFAAAWDTAADVEYTFYGLGCLALLAK